MDAANWNQCPRCGEIDQKLLDSKYGKIFQKEFLRLVAEEKKRSREDSLKENYEIGIFSGVFSIRYYATCEECGFEFKYYHKENIE